MPRKKRIPQTILSDNIEGDRTLTRRGLAELLTEHYPELTQSLAYNIIQTTIDEIARALINGKNVEFRDFGVFQVVMRKSRPGRNPKRPTDTVIIPEHPIVKFKTGRILKAQLRDSVKAAE